MKRRSDTLVGSHAGLPEDNPFQTMYQRTIGKTGHDQATKVINGMARSSSQVVVTKQKEKPSRRSSTAIGIPRSKSTAKNNAFKEKERNSVDTYPVNHGKKQPLELTQDELTKTLKYLQANRKFGSQSVEGHKIPARVDIGDFHIKSNTVHSRVAPTGHHVGPKQTRCTDRFIRYTYPKHMTTRHKEMFEHKNSRTQVKSHKQAWNLEKEAKIINPNGMALYTTKATAYQGQQEKTRRPQEVKHIEPPKPCNKESSYAKSFPNWKNCANGQTDVFLEKEPQYPYYQLPFRGKSNYKENYTLDQMNSYMKQQAELKKIQELSKHKLVLGSYQQQPFNYTTTNNEKLKDFKIATAFINDQQHYQSSKDQHGKRKHQAATSKGSGMPEHYRTVCQKTWVNHQSQYKRSKADFIPYP